jgi:phenylpropionate dioxygenase-like ring-hydroxylating dioxygenase large terminal subunit
VATTASNQPPRRAEAEAEPDGPVLPDGTPLFDLVDLEHRTISPRISTEMNVLRWENQRVFPPRWNLLAHAAEFEATGDFRGRQIGWDPVLVTRGPDSTLDLLLNICTHEPLLLCRHAAGNAERFQCPFHGWTFDREGHYLPSQFEIRNFGDNLNVAARSLRRGRCEEWNGLVFGTFDAAVPALAEWLGAAALAGLSDLVGLTVLGPPQRRMVHANWKAAGARLARDTVGTLWPNVGWDRDTIHTVTPRGPERCEIVTWVLVAPDTPEPQHQEARWRSTHALERVFDDDGRWVEPFSGVPDAADDDAWAWWTEYLAAMAVPPVVARR